MHPEISQGAKDLPPPIYVGCMAVGTWQLLGDLGVMGSKAGGLAREQVQKQRMLIAFCKGCIAPATRGSASRNH